MAVTAKVDEILSKAAVELDQAKRKALYAEFQQLVGAELPIYWLNSMPYHTAHSKKLANPPTGIWGAMHPLDRMYWAEKK